MNKLEFSIEIKASKESIWKALWDDQCYRDWAGVFLEGSYAIADNWKTGSTVQFLAPDQSGIYSFIEEHIPNKIIRFKHIGNVVEGKKEPVDEKSKHWSGATEIYKVVSGNDINSLNIEIDVMNEHLQFMTKTFPKALEKIKHNCL